MGEKVNMKNSFILYHEFSDYINKLTDEQTGQLLKAIFAYEQDGTAPQLDPITDMVFTIIQNQLDKNKAKYEEKCEQNRENAKKRWAEQEEANECERIPPHNEKCERKKQNANYADNDNDNDYDNDSISPPNPLTGESEPESEKPKPRKRTLTAEQRERFALFWNAYPNQVGIGAAEKEWAKLSPSAELTEEIVAAVRTAKEKDHRFSEARYTPRPANWIMNREWKNKYSNETRKNTSNNTFIQREYTQEELSKFGHRIGVITDDDERSDEE